MRHIPRFLNSMLMIMVVVAIGFPLKNILPPPPSSSMATLTAHPPKSDTEVRAADREKVHRGTREIKKRTKTTPAPGRLAWKRKTTPSSDAIPRKDEWA